MSHLLALLAAEEPVPGWITAVQTGGLLTFLLVVVWGAIRKDPWWVSGSVFRRSEEECQRRMTEVESSYSTRIAEITVDYTGRLNKTEADLREQIRIVRDELTQWRAAAMQGTSALEFITSRQHDFKRQEDVR